jgi:monothiol glutaredoxin
MDKPKLFVKTGCPYCRAAMEWLDGHEVAYEKLDVVGNRDLMQQLHDISGQVKTPTMQLNGDVLADFDVEQIEPFLQKHNAL